MMHPAATLTTSNASVSDLILSDRLIALAQDADRAGFTDTAERLRFASNVISVLRR